MDVLKKKNSFHAELFGLLIRFRPDFGREETSGPHLLSQNCWCKSAVAFAVVAAMLLQTQVFLLLSDSNVERHMNPTNLWDRPLMSAFHFLPFGGFVEFTEAICSNCVRNESNIVRHDCLPHQRLHLLRGRDSSLKFCIKPTLQEALGTLNAIAEQTRDQNFLVAPPM